MEATTSELLGLRDRVAIAKRRPKRLTITLPYGVADRLREQSQWQGRSVSNLAACLLEASLTERNL
jgi:hypothetical protein